MPLRSLFRNLLIYIAIFFCTGTAMAAELRVDRLRLGLTEGQTRVVLELSAPGNLTAHLYNDPDRVELEIANATWNAPGFTPEGRGVVREFSADGGRITLLLSQKATIANVFALPPGGGKPDRMVIDLKPATPAEFDSKIADAQEKVPSPTAKANVLMDPDARVVEIKTEAKPEVKKTAVKNTGKKPVIVIDAGHGGQDPGAISPGGLREKDITLAVARALREELRDHYRVILTRDSDVFLKLAERVRVAQRNKADLFISLHADTVGASSDAALTRGASIYTISDKASDEVAARLAARENKADLLGGKPDLAEGTVGVILLDLLNQETMERSKTLANAVIDGMEDKEITLLERPHRSAGFAVLKGADFPSVLIEMGFLSSPKDGNLLRDRAHQARLAHAIATGVDGFFAEDKVSHGD